MKRDTILIVDDVELNRAILCELFCKDYQVLEAGDGLCALSLIEENSDRFVAILLDIRMPELDGFAVLEWMNERKLVENNIPVIMITAEDSEQIALRCYELGVSDIINKPFSPSIVRHRVENSIMLQEYRNKLENAISIQRENMENQAKKDDRVSLKSFFQRPARDEEEIFSIEEANIFAPTHTEDSVSSRVLWLLELEREKYRMLSEMTGDIIFSYDIDSDTMEFSDRFEMVFGTATRYRRFLARLMHSRFIYSEDRRIVINTIRNLKNSPRRDVIQVRMVSAHDKVEWYEAHLQPLLNQESGECIAYIGKLINIHDMKAEADRWREQAYHDGLTKLYNRKALDEMSEKFFHNKTDNALHDEAILFFVDIDNFKKLNDQFGHRFGDSILKYVSCRMREKFRTTDIVGRIGGDEFVVLIHGLQNKADIERKAQELCEIFLNATSEECLEFPVSGSVGIARYPQDAQDYEELLHKADMALYHAKKQGKNCYAFYSDLNQN